jgi:plasmid stability protein
MNDEFRAMTLRMPTDLFERLRACAAEHRSAGAEVRMIVREHLAQSAEKSAPTEKATP